MFGSWFYIVPIFVILHCSKNNLKLCLKADLDTFGVWNGEMCSVCEKETCAEPQGIACQVMLGIQTNASVCVSEIVGW